MIRQNIETRIANRAKSIFSSLGAIINDFYLEAGIYFVGGFNASLVAWGIYTDLLVNGQPLPYAITIAIVAFIAVEGLAVYLVGAAARANSRLLWFFSIVFAVFFTFAHYIEMTDQGVISEYVKLAIPFFVVIGYWAKTLKADIENNHAQTTQQRDEELARKHHLEDEELARSQKLEDEDRADNRETDRKRADNKHELKLASLSETAGTQPENSNWKNDQNTGNGVLPEINSGRKLDRADILERLPGFISDGYSNVEIGKMVGRNERTIRNYRHQLNDRPEGAE
ncbi:hypothetical protein LCGC14_0561970 [marine sediment metagenome]|uniref:Uncharacterized protein n=1 Tax=marine sediment metagenome TaxID=412755 RepID=A0A0F9RLR3_9ZZZZ